MQIILMSTKYFQIIKFEKGRSSVCYLGSTTVCSEHEINVNSQTSVFHFSKGGNKGGNLDQELLTAHLED